MPTKHLKETSWDLVKKATYDTVINTGTVIKESEMLNYLIMRGAASLTEEDYDEIIEDLRKQRKLR